MKLFNLITDAWLPVRRKSGSYSIIRPAEITSLIDVDPVVHFAWGRADLDAASREFMIGLLVTACPPDNNQKFREWWSSPPNTEKLNNSFMPFIEAFTLDGGSVRFMQDMDELGSEESSPIFMLPIEAPGDNTLKKNSDLFQHRGQFQALSRAAAAICVFTLQTYAGSGGAGYRTSVRGGGPLTTLVTTQNEYSLWHKVWLNTPGPYANYPSPANVMHLVFPWLAATITSEGNPPPLVSPQSSHILQAYWGMPRRIRLVFTPNTDGIRCPITNIADEVIVTEFRTHNYGVNYGSNFQHDLTPHYLSSKTQEWLPVHGQPGGIPYRDWPDLAGEPTEMTRPARIVSIAELRLTSLGLNDEARLTVAGYDMSNASARAFHETQIPLFVIPDNYNKTFYQVTRALVVAAELTAKSITTAIKIALAGDRADGSALQFSDIGARFYTDTEDLFYKQLRGLLADLRKEVGDPSKVTTLHAEKWLIILRKAALGLFDECVPLGSMHTSSAGRSAAARYQLSSYFSGFGSNGRKIFAALSLPGPETKKTKSKDKKPEIAA